MGCLEKKVKQNDLFVVRQPFETLIDFTPPIVIHFQPSPLLHQPDTGHSEESHNCKCPQGVLYLERF